MRKVNEQGELKRSHYISCTEIKETKSFTEEEKKLLRKGAVVVNMADNWKETAAIWFGACVFFCFCFCFVAVVKGLAFLYPIEQNDIFVFSCVAVWSSFYKERKTIINFYYIVPMLKKLLKFYVFSRISASESPYVNYAFPLLL